jgi:uncharacterized protein (TIGR02231 family)
MAYKYFLIGILLITGFLSFSQVTDVTLYLDRALVSRTSVESSKDGVHEMIFKNIPLTAGLDSIRAKGYVSKNASLKILDIRVEKNFVKAAVIDSNVLKLQIDTEKKNIARLNALKARLGELKNNLEIFSGVLKQNNDKDLKEGTFNVKQWEEGLNLYSGKLELIDPQSLSADDEIKKSNEKITQLQFQLNQDKKTDSFYTQDAYVTYQLKGETDVRIILNYIITNAGWYPLYDCRMDMKNKNLSLEYYARVFQNTGEDWNNVNLVLSTARPDLSGQVPVLSPWQLDFRDYVQRSNDDMKSKSVKKEDVESELALSESSLSRNQRIVHRIYHIVQSNCHLRSEGQKGYDIIGNRFQTGIKLGDSSEI